MVKVLDSSNETTVLHFRLYSLDEGIYLKAKPGFCTLLEDV